MSDTAIQWTDKTWNPFTGCTRVSAGCDHCYAFQLHDQRHVAWKRGRMPNAAPQYHQPFSRVQLLPDRLTQPLSWRKPARVFVNSMSDLFHEDVPDDFIARVFAVMALASQHTFQVLTKRPERMAKLLLSESFVPAWPELPRWKWSQLVTGAAQMPSQLPLPNVWLGTSVENQQTADERIPWLLKTRAAVRFLSAEPLLGPVDLTEWTRCTCTHDWYEGDHHTYWCRASSRSYLPKLRWVIAGGESGAHARPMHPDWARSLRDACVGAGVPFFYKQWGEWWHESQFIATAPDILNERRDKVVWPDQSYSVDVGKKRAGRLLDGVEWSQFPEVRA